MNISPIIQSQSKFMQEHIPVFLERFLIEYYKENPCIEYFVYDRKTGNTISSSVVLSYNSLSNDLHVSRFHPELYLEIDSKYMSAVCFYLIIHHSMASFSLDNTCHISLETKPTIGDDFYKKLKDFNFQIRKYGLGNVVELVSDTGKGSIDTSIIKEHIFISGEIPFLR